MTIAVGEKLPDLKLKERTPDGPADISMMGSGDVDVGPDARCKTSKMGTGTVRCG